MPPPPGATTSTEGPHLRQRLTTACTILLIAALALDHRPIPPILDTTVALLGTALAAGLAVRSAPRTRVLYLAAALFGVSVALSSLPIRSDLPMLGMSRAFYLPALALLAFAAILAWPELRDSLNQSRDKLRTAAVENNRAHTSRELHDETLQALIHLRRSLERAADSHDPALVHTAVTDGAALAADQIAALRDIIADLHPTILTEIGLDAAVEALVDRTSRHHPQPQITYTTAGVAAHIDTAAALTTYRIAQESLTNAVKHSGATAITVSLTQHGSDLELCVADNGTGLHATPPSDSGLGIPAMRARAELHHGRLAIDSTAEGGTTVTAHLRAGASKPRIATPRRRPSIPTQPLGHLSDPTCEDRYRPAQADSLP